MIRKDLTKIRTGFYVILIIIAVIGAKALELRERGIFACQSYGYSADIFAAYCGGDDMSTRNTESFGMGSIR
jgi:hypothetical protein